MSYLTDNIAEVILCLVDLFHFK